VLLLCALVAYRCGRERWEEAESGESGEWRKRRVEKAESGESGEWRKRRVEKAESGESGDGLFFTSLIFGWIGIWEELLGIGSGLPFYWVTRLLLGIRLRFFPFLLKRTSFRALFYLICLAG